MLIGYYRNWQRGYRNRKRYSTQSREPFFALAAKYYPDAPGTVGIDVGAGVHGLKDYLQKCGLEGADLNRLQLLDANERTVKLLRKAHGCAILYEAPGPLPFRDGSVSFVHCSHIIEHLEHRALYAFMKEIDRTLRAGGYLVVSTPLLWSRFYDDLSHVRPYNPHVLLHYLNSGGQNRSAVPVSNAYRKVELIYRYSTLSSDDGWGSSIGMLDWAAQTLKAALNWAGFGSIKETGTPWCS